MNHGRVMTKAMPLLIGIGLFLSACAAESDYGAPAYAEFDYGDYGDYGGWHHGWGHGFGHGGFGGHGGGGHR